MIKKEMIKTQTGENKQNNKAWVKALIIISIFTVFSLSCSFIFFKMLPSKISIHIKTATEIISLGGGIAIFYIIFKLLFSSFKKLLPFLVLLILSASIINLFIFLNYYNRFNLEFKKMEIRNESLKKRLNSTNSEINKLKNNLSLYQKLLSKNENSDIIKLIVKVLRKTSSILICEDLIMNNKTLSFPLDKIKIVSENEKYTIIKVPNKLYIKLKKKNDF